MEHNALRSSKNRSNRSTDYSNITKKIELTKFNITQTIDLPIGIFLFDQLPLLFSYSSVYDFKPRWNMRPDYAAYDIYEDTNLAWLLLYINQCPSVMHFNKQNYKFIYAPLENYITKAISYIQENKKKVIA